MNINEKACPFCAEIVKVNAKLCKHCHSDISKSMNNDNVSINNEIKQEIANWFYSFGEDHLKGPITISELVKIYLNGEISATVKVKEGEESEWQKIGEIAKIKTYIDTNIDISNLNNTYITIIATLPLIYTILFSFLYPIHSVIPPQVN